METPEMSPYQLYIGAFILARTDKCGQVITLLDTASKLPPDAQDMAYFATALGLTFGLRQDEEVIPPQVWNDTKWEEM